MSKATSYFNCMSLWFKSDFDWKGLLALTTCSSLPIQCLSPTVYLMTFVDGDGVVSPTSNGVYRCFAKDPYIFAVVVLEEVRNVLGHTA